MFRLAPRQAHLRKGEGPHSVAQWPPLGSQRGRADWPGGPRRPGIRVLGGQGMTPQEEQCVPPTVLASPLSTSPAPCLPPQLQQVHSALLLPTSLCCLRNRMLLLLSRYIVSHSFVTQAPLSMEFPRQEYLSGSPCLSPVALSNPGIELGSPTWQADSSPVWATHLGSPRNQNGTKLSARRASNRVVSQGQVKLRNRESRGRRYGLRGVCLF